MNSSWNKIQFKNEPCNMLNERIDLFVACIGYEDRSYFIYKKLVDRLEPKRILLFAIDDFASYDSARRVIADARANGIECCIVKYNDAEQVQKKIVITAQDIFRENECSKIHIDYSSMPRGWYCKIPELLEHVLPSSGEVFFWYTEGEYEQFENEYPTVGIDSYTLYSGKPSLLERKRTHFIGVGYDSIRTNGIITLLNPEIVITCEANNPTRTDVWETIKRNNREIFNESFMNLSLDITDIEFMIAKMCGIVNEVYSIANSDIILVPDGPKPLIFVMSMLPWLCDEQGICCLHIKRNDKIFKARNVRALRNDLNSSFSQNDHIIGFSLKKRV